LSIASENRTVAAFVAVAAAVIALNTAGCPRKKKEMPKPVVSSSCTTIRRGETIDNSLRRLMSQDQVAAVVTALRNADFPFRHCLPGDTLTLVKSDSVFSKMVYKQSPTVIYYVEQADPCMTVAMKCPFIDKMMCFTQGSVKSTLYEALIDQGEKPELIYRFADVFSWEIDFTTETQKGDSFFIMLEKSYCDSILIGYSSMPIVRYKGEVGDYYGIYFMDRDGYDDYYSRKGESLRKSLLKSPLKYSHISSYFTEHRFHPILKIWRPHHGLDYCAPTGTPVSSIGDGTVTFKGWNGGYGNLVEIRHKNGFRTRYGHLSRYAKGLFNGGRVKMGEIIGYVGMTGLATGPHLHFELRKDGVPINPLKVKLPRAPSVKAAYMKEFTAQGDSLVASLNAGLTPAVASEEDADGSKNN
jgi:murein DD-endopeptidase MepM/ murein hydrolase activator NlpD